MITWHLNNNDNAQNAWRSMQIFYAGLSEYLRQPMFFNMSKLDNKTFSEVSHAVQKSRANRMLERICSISLMSTDICSAGKRPHSIIMNSHGKIVEFQCCLKHRPKLLMGSSTNESTAQKNGVTPEKNGINT